MRLVDEFTIESEPASAFAMLVDLQRIGPCVPGGEIDAPNPDGVFPGRVSVKLGPMKFVYSGQVRIAEQDPIERTAIIEGEGRASGGSDSARVHSRIEVMADGAGSRVRITTDLDIKGRAAQMGQGVIADVSRRLVSQAAECIGSRIEAASGDHPGAAAPAKPVGGVSLMASVVGSRVRDAASNLAGRGPRDDPEDPAGGEDDGTR